MVVFDANRERYRINKNLPERDHLQDTPFPANIYEKVKLDVTQLYPSTE